MSSMVSLKSGMLLQGVLEPGSGQEVTLTVWINGGLKGTAQLAAAAQVRSSQQGPALFQWLAPC